MTKKTYLRFLLLAVILLAAMTLNTQAGGGIPVGKLALLSITTA